MSQLTEDPVPWNIDFTTLAHQPWATVSSDPALARMFGKAVTERERAMTSGLGIPVGMELPLTNGHAPPLSAAALRYWTHLRSRVWDLANSFVPADFTERQFIPSWRGTERYIPPDAPLLGNPPAKTGTTDPFPPTGLTRSWRREIWKLTCLGEEGQLARFTARLGTPWRGAATTDEAFGQPRPRDVPPFSPPETPEEKAEREAPWITPEGERHLSGKFFRHTGGVWSPVQGVGILDCEVLSETRLVRFRDSVGTSVMDFSGDRFTAAYLNELRDAINLLTMTAAPIDTLKRVTPAGDIVNADDYSVPSAPSKAPIYIGDPETPFELRYLVSPAGATNPYGLVRNVSLWQRLPFVDHAISWGGTWREVKNFDDTASRGEFRHDCGLGKVKFRKVGPQMHVFGPPAALVERWNVLGGFEYVGLAE